MSGVQTSILPSPEQNRHAFDPPYEANDLVALAFARYPYPEFFFGWTPSSEGTVMFARTDRLPPWISAHERADVYPVEVRRDPSEIEALPARRSGHRRPAPVFGVRHLDRGARYQVIALLARGDDTGTAGPRVRRGGESRVGARPLLQRHPAAGCADRRKCQGHIFAIIDEHGRRVAGTSRGSRPRRAAFPLFLTHAARGRSAGRSQAAILDRRHERAGDPTFVLAARAAKPPSSWARGVAPRIQPLATARAARASAAVATIRADFVATVTHELKTPLATIRAVGETLVRAPRQDRGGSRPHALLVREERRLTRLVNNLLAYSRVTDVTEVYSFEALEPEALISEATQGFRRQELTDSEYGSRSTWRPTFRRCADRTAIVLALDNLIDNAIRYSGNKTVSVRGRSGARPLRRHRSRSRHTRRRSPQVRRRFVRGTARGPGNGLGLAIVNRIATDHGGSLEMTSELGHGTTATLIIPKAEPNAPRILIVEDDSSLAQILRDNLLVDGFDVESAQCGCGARCSVRSSPISSSWT